MDTNITVRQILRWQADNGEDPKLAFTAQKCVNNKFFLKDKFRRDNTMSVTQNLETVKT